MRTLAFFTGTLLLVVTASGSPESLERARSAVHEWVKAEKAISREEVEWEAEKVLLGDLIAVAEARIERLEAELAESEASLSAADAARQELLAREEALDREAAVIEGFLVRAEQDLRRLSVRLPEPLQRELEAVYQRLPEDSEKTSRSLGEREKRQGAKYFDYPDILCPYSSFPNSSSTSKYSAC